MVGMAPHVSEAFLGGNPFSNGLPLTMTSAVMCISGHLEEAEACRFVSLLRERLTGGDEPTLDIAASLCPGQTNSQALQRLLLVLIQLEQIRHMSPTLLKVDGERVVP